MKVGVPGGNKGWKLTQTKLDITCGYGVPNHRIPIPIPKQYDSAFYFNFTLNEPEKAAEIEALLRLIGVCALSDEYDYEEKLADKVDELSKQLTGKLDCKVVGNALYMAYFYNVTDIKKEYKKAPRNCIDYFLKKKKYHWWTAEPSGYLFCPVYRHLNKIKRVQKKRLRQVKKVEAKKKKKGWKGT